MLTHARKVVTAVFRTLLLVSAGHESPLPSNQVPHHPILVPAPCTLQGHRLDSKEKTALFFFFFFFPAFFWFFSASHIVGFYLFLFWLLWVSLVACTLFIVACRLSPVAAHRLLIEVRSIVAVGA